MMTDGISILRKLGKVGGLRHSGRSQMRGKDAPCQVSREPRMPLVVKNPFTVEHSQLGALNAIDATVLVRLPWAGAVRAGSSLALNHHGAGI